MQRILGDFKPEKLFYYFEEISRIPRNSHEEKQISDYLMRFASDHGWEARRDAVLNTVIDVPASSGYEDRPKVILQGHMDMVCVKEPGIEHDFAKDAIPLAYDGDWIYAKGTTLGADDGKAIALILALLDDKTLKHPPIQAVFTSSEEIGLYGAQNIDAAMLDGKYFIGLDYSSDENVLVSCAGSSEHMISIPTEKMAVTDSAKKKALSIALNGLTSGHGGGDIHRYRANGVRLICEILCTLREQFSIELAAIAGGSKPNVIPANGCATVLLSAADAQAAEMRLEKLRGTLKTEYQHTDPELDLVCTEIAVPSMRYSEKTLQSLLDCVDLLPLGLFNYLDTEHKFCKSSCNMGMVFEEADCIKISEMVRGNSNYQHAQAIRRIRRAADRCGATYEQESYTPAWEIRDHSPLAQQISDIWEKVRGVRPELNIIHATVEGGIFIEKMAALGKDIDVVNIGVKNPNVHTTKERMSIASFIRAYELLHTVLEELQ